MTIRGGRPAALLLAGVLWLLVPANATGEGRIVALSPDKGPSSGGTLVSLQVEGGMVLGPLQVMFGNRPASVVRRVGLSRLEAVTPPGTPGPVPVRVVNDLWQTGTRPAVFTYTLTPPRLVRLDPLTVPVGAADLVFQVEGEYFTATSHVHVAETRVSTTFVSPQRLQAKVAASFLEAARSLDVRVIDAALGGGTSNVLSVTVVNPPPLVTGLEAPLLKAGDAATSVTVRGQDFRPDSTIQIGGTPVATTYRTGEELVAVIPPEVLAKAGDLPITVVTPGPGGGTFEALGLTVLAPPPAPPPFPGRFLVFTSNRGGGRNHIFLLDRQMRRLDRLEEANSVYSSDGYPSISADGRYVVFQSDRRDGQSDVFLFDRETRTLDALPELNHPTAFDGFPHLSADGRFIVFESDRLNGKPKIFLFDRKTRTLAAVNEANDATADDGLAAISN